MTPELDSFQGGLLGLGLGDALCAPYEGGLPERLLWRMLGKTKEGRLRYTDDTQMAMALAEHLSERGEILQDELALRYAADYEWSRGYGPGAAWLLKQIYRGVSWREAVTGKFETGSFGNGSAMRAPVVGLYFSGNEDEIIRNAALDSAITHCHPLAMEGSKLIALTTSWGANGDSSSSICDRLNQHVVDEMFRKKLELSIAWLENNIDPAAHEVVKALGSQPTALGSCVTAIYLFLRFRERPFIELIQFIRNCRGDTDTIAAMSGAMWGACNGSTEFGEEIISKIEGGEDLLNLSNSLYKKLGR